MAMVVLWPKMKAPQTSITAPQTVRTTLERRRWSNESATREDEDEEGADPSNDADDLTDVRHVHGDEQRHGDPRERQRVAAAPFKRRRHHAVMHPPPAQHGVLDHGPDV